MDLVIGDEDEGAMGINRHSIIVPTTTVSEASKGAKNPQQMTKTDTTTRFVAIFIFLSIFKNSKIKHIMGFWGFGVLGFVGGWFEDTYCRVG